MVPHISDSSRNVPPLHKNLSEENGIGVGHCCCVTIDSVFIVQFHDSVLDCACLVFAQPVRNAADSTRLLVKHETHRRTRHSRGQTLTHSCAPHTQTYAKAQMPAGQLLYVHKTPNVGIHRRPCNKSSTSSARLFTTLCFCASVIPANCVVSLSRVCPQMCD